MELCPDAAALLKIVAFRNPEIARYASERFNEKMIKLKRQDDPAAIKMGQHLSQYADLLENNYPLMSAAMRGSRDALQSEVQLFHEKLTQEAQQELAEFSSKLVNMIYGISDNSEILRGYSIDGEKTDSSVDEQMDTLMSAWLATHGLLVLDGIIYEADATGSQKLDANKNPIRANSGTLLELFENSEKGISKYFEKKGLNLETKVYPYPQETVTQKISENVQPDVSNQSDNQPVTPDNVNNTGMGQRT